MNFDELKGLWHTREPDSPVSAARDLEQVRKRAKELERAVYWRDFRELGAGMGVMVFFGAFAVLFDGAVRWGSLAAAFSAVVVSGVLLYSRLLMARHRPEPGDSVREALRHALFKARVQYWLLKQVAWWYLLPLGLGILAFIVSVEHVSTTDNSNFLWFYGVVCASLFIIVNWMNRQAAREKFLPHIRHLESVLAELEE